MMRKTATRLMAKRMGKSGWQHCANGRRWTESEWTLTLFKIAAFPCNTRARL
jgi:hypothetical protein